MENKKIDPDPRLVSIFASLIVIVIVGLTIWGIISIFVETPEEKIKKTRQQEAQAADNKILSDQVARAGRKPLSMSFSGIAHVIDKYLEANLKDPDSLDVIDCSAIMFNGGQWIQRVKYRAKNSYGGFEVSNQVFSVVNSKVVAVRDF